MRRDEGWRRRGEQCGADEIRYAVCEGRTSLSRLQDGAACPGSRDRNQRVRMARCGRRSRVRMARVWSTVEISRWPWPWPRSGEARRRSTLTHGSHRPRYPRSRDSTAWSTPGPPSGPSDAPMALGILDGVLHETRSRNDDKAVDSPSRRRKHGRHDQHGSLGKVVLSLAGRRQHHHPPLLSLPNPLPSLSIPL